ncbi:MAG: hypothetical protein M0020_00120 [Actinomycetota bacterium]|nr:hypothetical protein [Actinomycetota bacterium]
MTVETGGTGLARGRALVTALAAGAVVMAGCGGGRATSVSRQEQTVHRVPTTRAPSTPARGSTTTTARSSQVVTSVPVDGETVSVDGGSFDPTCNGGRGVYPPTSPHG